MAMRELCHFVDGMRNRRHFRLTAKHTPLCVRSCVVIRVAAVSSRAAPGIPTIQNGAEHPSPILSETLPGEERALRRGLTCADHKNYAIRKMTQHACVGEMDHRRSVDQDHVEFPAKPPQ